MEELIIAKVGSLQFNEDHWECWNIPTKIGPVDLQFDFVSIDRVTLPSKVQTFFDHND